MRRGTGGGGESASLGAPGATHGQKSAAFGRSPITRPKHRRQASEGQASESAGRRAFEPRRKGGKCERIALGVTARESGQGWMEGGRINGMEAKLVVDWPRYGTGGAICTNGCASM